MTPNPTSTDPIERLLYWIVERDRMRVQKEAGAPRPWTNDPVLHHNRFCNVRREDDRVTVWIKKNWRDPHTEDPYLWFAMVVARIFNLPPTLKELGYPIPFDEYNTLQLMNRYTREKRQIFNGAYIISTNGNAMPKNDYIVKRVLSPLWSNRQEITPNYPVTSLASFHKSLMKWDGLGSFMAAQVIADLKHTVNYLHAADWTTFAASGPGSRRGMNRLLGRPIDASTPENVWWRNLNYFRDIVNQALHQLNLSDEYSEVPEDIHAQDFQNCLCEFDKWERATRDGRKPKQVYKPNRHAY